MRLRGPPVLSDSGRRGEKLSGESLWASQLRLCTMCDFWCVYIHSEDEYAEFIYILKDVFWITNTLEMI